MEFSIEISKKNLELLRECFEGIDCIVDGRDIKKDEGVIRECFFEQNDYRDYDMRDEIKVKEIKVKKEIIKILRTNKKLALEILKGKKAYDKEYWKVWGLKEGYKFAINLLLK